MDCQKKKEEKNVLVSLKFRVNTGQILRFNFFAFHLSVLFCFSFGDHRVGVRHRGGSARTSYPHHLFPEVSRTEQIRA